MAKPFGKAMKSSWMGSRFLRAARALSLHVSALSNVCLVCSVRRGAFSLVNDPELQIELKMRCWSEGSSHWAIKTRVKLWNRFWFQKLGKYQEPEIVRSAGLLSNKMIDSFRNVRKPCASLHQYTWTYIDRAWKPITAVTFQGQRSFHSHVRHFCFSASQLPREFQASYSQCLMVDQRDWAPLRSL